MNINDVDNRIIVLTDEGRIADLCAIERAIDSENSRPGLGDRLAHLKADLTACINQPSMGFYGLSLQRGRVVGYVKASFLDLDGTFPSCILIVRQTPDCKGSFVNNLTFGSLNLGALRRCESLVWLATRRAPRLASHPNSAAKCSSYFLTSPKDSGCWSLQIRCAIQMVEDIFSSRDVAARVQIYSFGAGSEGAEPTDSAKLKLHRRLEVMEFQLKEVGIVPAIDTAYSTQTLDLPLNDAFWSGYEASLVSPIDCFDRPLKAVRQWGEALMPGREFLPLAITRNLDRKIIATMLPFTLGAVGWCEAVGVDPKLRRTGLAKTMVLRAIELFRARGVSSIKANVDSVRNPVAKSFFESCGFLTVSSTDIMMVTT